MPSPNESRRLERFRLRTLVSAVIGLLFVSASNTLALADKANAPIPAATLALMAARGTDAASPIVLRAYKKESEIEVWKRNAAGRYVPIKTYPICRWSGQLGPKTKTGDRQTPEGFYTVAKSQMNPNSRYYLSFDVGYPNAYDRAHGSTGSAVMVHGVCSSMGCFAMTDAVAGELFSIAREAFSGGQRAFQFQSFPFRMTAANMARHRTDPNIAFWRQLKEGSDRFEATGEEPVVSVSGGRYTFAPSPDPAKEAAFTALHKDETDRIAALVEEGAAAVRTTYSDGGQHAFWAARIRQGFPVGDISRPEALAYAGQEVVLIPARRRSAPPPPVPEAVWAAWIGPGSPSLALRTADFVPPYEAAPGRFTASVARYAQSWPSLARAAIETTMPLPELALSQPSVEKVAQR
ncbi:MAG TPA: murein L,D-transpeptidase family protein [Methylobacterium sp.]|jgi:murein L,D-transpeptidase YafK|uniref:L,D-transpeptidase family protein n=1 Tax=Methylorubrum sp. B1-46 TaxID=2897334 RepID=UPI001E5E0E02|nr:murein L,D-transpeptidase family protein [Methylorubrum sp. B1-46]UGB25657.1 murein L,D-transpeptidase [Methylorubrum sp. B1-46]HEV2541183.1 murein L,D-transpeptidase family protein [Methylobacterium sp.]